MPSVVSTGRTVTRELLEAMRAGPAREVIETIPDADVAFMAIEPGDSRATSRFFDYLTPCRQIEDTEKARMEYARRYPQMEE